MIDPATGAARFVDRVRAEEESRDAAGRAVRDRVVAAVAELAPGMGACRAMLFGSVAWGGFEPQRSDVDVMFWGLDDRAAVNLTTELWRRVERPVHVVRAETADRGLVTRVLRDGVRIHGG